MLNNCIVTFNYLGVFKRTYFRLLLFSGLKIEFVMYPFSRMLFKTKLACIKVLQIKLKFAKFSVNCYLEKLHCAITNSSIFEIL